MEKGLFKKRWLCPGCGGELQRPSSVVSTTKSELFLTEQSLAVELSVPLYRCAGCNADAIGPQDEVGGAVMKAAAHAFRAGNIDPG